ncbi:MAG: hypothetical protein P1Q69_17205, partial [Candidatus Thorarchaeota archaeon]|nr:hypothetical protein [Candidatus Thorarchaeota archaeon]
QVLELGLTALAIALPAILALVIVLEIIGISRISKSMSHEISQMESPALFESFLNSIASKKTISKSAEAVELPSPELMPIEAEINPIDDEDIEPIIVTSFDFIEASNPDSVETEEDESETPAVKDIQETVPFGDIAFQDASFSDFELIVSEDGSFKLKQSEMEEEE